MFYRFSRINKTYKIFLKLINKYIYQFIKIIKIEIIDKISIILSLNKNQNLRIFIIRFTFLLINYTNKNK